MQDNFNGTCSLHLEAGRFELELCFTLPYCIHDTEIVRGRYTVEGDEITLLAETRESSTEETVLQRWSAPYSESLRLHRYPKTGHLELDVPPSLLPANTPCRVRLRHKDT